METTPFKAPKTVSAFGRAALALDVEFVEFDRLAAELVRVNLVSDKGMDRATALLTHIDDCRRRLQTAMQAMAQALDDARAASESAANAVAERAMTIQGRQEEAAQLVQRFKTLGEMVKKVTTIVGDLRAASGEGGMAAADQSMLIEQWPDLNAQLGILVDEARKLMDDAHAADMKTLAGNADSLRQSLQAARQKLGAFIGSQVPGSASALAPAVDDETGDSTPH